MQIQVLLQDDKLVSWDAYSTDGSTAPLPSMLHIAVWVTPIELIGGINGPVYLVCVLVGFLFESFVSKTTTIRQADTRSSKTVHGRYFTDTQLMVKVLLYFIYQPPPRSIGRTTAKNPPIPAAILSRALGALQSRRANFFSIR